jgi:hypothetical protein
MSQSTGQLLGQKTHPGVVGRPTFGERSTIRKPRPVPASYPAKHPCKVCDGKHCTGNCQF